MARLSALIEVDGSYGEGGGALLRTALTMAAHTQQPLLLRQIRGGTAFPGLDLEDLAILRVLRKSCDAEVEGGALGSLELRFAPRTKPSAWNGETAALELPPSVRGLSVPTVLNALLPILARTGAYSDLKLKGETYGKRALSYDYFACVTLQAYRAMGLHAFPEQLRPGFGRESKGEARLEIEPSVLTGLRWGQRGKLCGCRAVLTTARLGRGVGARGVSHLEALATQMKLPLEIEVQELETEGPGCFLTLWAEFERGLGGATAMGMKGLRVESLAQTGLAELRRWLGSEATLDPFLADQLLVALAIAEGDSEFQVSELTQRFLTMVWVIKQFLPIRLTVHGREGQPGTVLIHR